MSAPVIPSNGAEEFTVADLMNALSLMPAGATVRISIKMSEDSFHVEQAIPNIVIDGGAEVVIGGLVSYD